MNDTPLQLTLRELREVYTSPRWLAGLAAVALVLGIAGPFDTFALPLPGRIAYWTAVVFLTWGTGLAASTFVFHRFGHLFPHPAARLLVAGLGAGVPVAALVLAMNRIVFPDSDVTLAVYLTLAGYVIAISMVIVLIYTLLAGDAEPPTEDAAKAAPAILRRLDGPKRGRLISLSVQDHYVEVVTDKGASLVLMRLSDAIAETAPVRGVRVHRSHWVALDAVKSVGRRGGGATVRLVDGRELPVSRGQMAEARAAGLIA